MRSRQYSRPWTRGFSLPEILVTLAVMGIIMALIVPMILSARQTTQSEQLRTAVNQNLRVSMDLIGNDVRTAGERFPAASSLVLQPILITDGGVGAPDEILLRRGLWDATLPVCERVNGAEQGIIVVRDPAWLANPPGSNFPECGQPLDANGWPMNLADVRALQDTIGTTGELMGYIFDPAEPLGEFIPFEVRDNADQTGNIVRTTNAPLAHDYRRNRRPRVYIMTERNYRIRDDVLEVVPDDDEDNSLRAVADVVDLNADFVMDDGTVTKTIPNNMTWRDIAAVEVTITTRTMMDGEQEENSLTSRFFPRNVLSR